MTIDCGHCGSDNVELVEGSYKCTQCGKTYSPTEAETRSRNLAFLNRLRIIQVLLMAGCMVFLVVDAILLPGYANNGSRTSLVIAATALCLAFFLAALVVRIRFGRKRKELYSD